MNNVGDRANSNDGAWPNGTLFHPSGDVMQRGLTAEQKAKAERAAALEYLFNGGGQRRI
jgi:hypothetical protein